MAKGLTEKQQKILEFIIDFQQENGFPPTIRELGDAFSIGSLRGVTVHLDALVRKGYITRERTSRSIRVLSGDPREIDLNEGPFKPEAGKGYRKNGQGPSLPLIRRSGWSIENEEILTHDSLKASKAIEAYISIPNEIAGITAEHGFVFRVGASGIYGEPIVPGDLLVIHPQNTVAPGDLAVTLQDNYVSVNRHSADTGTEVAEKRETSSPLVIGRVTSLVRSY